MQLASRKLLDRSFSSLGIVSIVLLALSLVVILSPIIFGGVKAFVFKGTIEFRRVMLTEFGHGEEDTVDAQYDKAREARQPVYDALAAFDAELDEMGFLEAREYSTPYEDLKFALRELLGPLPGEDPIMLRDNYGVTRWDRAEVKRHAVLYREEYEYREGTSAMGVLTYVPRVDTFKGTALEPMFGYIEQNTEKMLMPEWTFYWRFLTDTSKDSHMFGGVYRELLGTFYLTIGAILFAVPMGVVSAIYLVEYADSTARYIQIIRSCISTLAGVPSIVFGLFGLAFFINTIGVSDNKSVLAGSLTLAILVLPLIIRASEEAIKAVPHTYKEASLSLGASRWRTIITVMLPASLPGILTGIVISMGRAAGETAPIIFTAAVSAQMGPLLKVDDLLTKGTPALPWNVYNLAAEHRELDEIQHVLYGMVFTLVLVVLLLNSVALIMRARISRKLRG